MAGGAPAGGPQDDLLRVICDQCGARSWLRDAELAERPCGECGGRYRTMGLFEGLVDRWFAPAEHGVSEFYPRHLKLIEMLWTAGGRGQETYEAVKPHRVSYTQFVRRTTHLVVRGLAEGWIEARLPAAPVEDDRQYQLRFLDPERWADELLAEFGETPRSPGTEPAEDAD